MQCSNPQCGKELRYLRDGLLELLELEPTSMEPMMKLSNPSGEGHAHAMGHTVCLTANENGGQVIE
jgi:hypothetical protein